MSKTPFIRNCWTLDSKTTSRWSSIFRSTALTRTAWAAKWDIFGGEKNLLQLAKLAAGDANILLLDEPSSHLDTFAQLALEEAIGAYKGAVLMVSHDFYTIVNCADTILFVENGGIRPMSARAFRKMIYKKHFSKDYLELELKKKDFETRIAQCLEMGDCVEAQRFCDKLAVIVEHMQQA